MEGRSRYVGVFFVVSVGLLTTRDPNAGDDTSNSMMRMMTMMDEFFVRVYHMKDGTIKEPYAVYALYDQALLDLDKFNPSGEGANDLDNVSYVTIEKMYAPKGTYWSGNESNRQSIHRAQQLMGYLDRLACLKGHGHYVNNEIATVITAINAELSLTT